MKKIMLTCLGTIAVACSLYFSLSGNQFSTQSLEGVSALETHLLAESEEYEAFMKFVAKFGKTYASHSDHNSKFQVFSQNYRRVKAHNESPANHSYKLGINKFSDMTEEEFLEMYGTLKKVEPSKKEDELFLSNPRL